MLEEQLQEKDENPEQTPTVQEDKNPSASVIKYEKKVKKNKQQKMEISVGKPLAISMLIASTRNDYNDMRNKCLECYKLQNHELLTFYYNMKKRPKMVNGVIDSIKEPYTILSREHCLAKEARKKGSRNKKR